MSEARDLARHQRLGEIVHGFLHNPIGLMQRSIWEDGLREQCDNECASVAMVQAAKLRQLADLRKQLPGSVIFLSSQKLVKDVILHRVAVNLNSFRGLFDPRFA